MIATIETGSPKVVGVKLSGWWHHEEEGQTPRKEPMSPPTESRQHPSVAWAMMPMPIDVRVREAGPSATRYRRP